VRNPPPTRAELSELEANLILAEWCRRHAPPKREFVAKREWRFLSELHKVQASVNALSDRRQAWLWGRRTGKTTLAAAKLVVAAGDHPNSHACYIALTRSQAKRNIWKELKRLSEDYSLGISFNETTLIATLPNGSEIALLGALNANDIERLRGTAFVLVVIDEAGSFPCRPARDGEVTGDLLKNLYTQILGPAMLDYLGTVVLCGTPTLMCRGYFFDVTQPTVAHRMKGWNVSHATVLDNPFVPKTPTAEIPDAATYLRKEVLEAQNLTDQDPTFRREWMAEWVRSVEALVYARFSFQKNVYATIPGDEHREWFYGASVDFGYDDPTVIGLFKWSHDDPTVYLTRIIKASGQIVSQIASTLKRLEREVGGFSFLVADYGGGSGKMFGEELRERHGFHLIKGAEKTKKPVYIESLNSDFQTGRFKVHESCVPLLDEISVLQWDPRALGRLEDERFANDCCDMMLYGWRETRGFEFDDSRTPDELIPPAPEREAQEIEDEIERRLKAQARDDFNGF
jgi:Terminase large subunit, T4likevirus-type, N-terminal